MAALPGDVSAFNTINKVLAQNKNDFQALQAMGKTLRSASLFLPSNSYYERALQRPEAKTNRSAREQIMSDIGLNSLELEDGKRAAELFEKCLKEFPNSDRRAEWTLNLARARALRR